MRSLYYSGDQAAIQVTRPRVALGRASEIGRSAIADRRGTLCLSPIFEAQVLNPRELSGIVSNQNHIQRASVAPNERIERPDRLAARASEARASP